MRQTLLHPNLRYWNPAPPRRETVSVDVCVYGGTAAAVVAAVQLRRRGRTVAVVAPERRLGGMTTGGLSFTDSGARRAIGGLAQEFYREVGKHYGVAEEFRFEPHVAHHVLLEMALAHQVPVFHGHFLQGVGRRGRRLRSLTSTSGLRVDARIFVDAGYDGDLMAAAGAPYAVGREGNAVYGESVNGVQVRATHQFDRPVDPYVRPGDPESGLLPGIDPEPLAPEGSGDRRIQAYNFRLCLTARPENRRPLPRPADYDPARYELLRRCLAAGWRDLFRKFDPIRGGKVDVNNYGAVSSDFIGQNHAWPEADHAERERLFQAHASWQAGWLWFLAEDPSVPAEIRERVRAWGPCRDEFPDTDGWSPQLYVRESRRLRGAVAMTEHHCRGRLPVPDPVGMGSYAMDSHHCRRFVRDGRVMNEGDVQVGVPPYGISYRAILPPRGACENLLVPVCVSASHIAYGSIRMEPVFMILAQSAALAADLALERDRALQEIPYDALRERLVDAGQALPETKER